MRMSWRTDCSLHHRIDGASTLNLPSACNWQANGSERAVSFRQHACGRRFVRYLPLPSGSFPLQQRGFFVAPSFACWFFRNVNRSLSVLFRSFPWIAVSVTVVIRSREQRTRALLRRKLKGSFLAILADARSEPNLGRAASEGAFPR